jgi:hypothetical protein
VECHRPGGAAPFALLTPRDWADHAAAIVGVLNNGSMPPWLVHGEHGEFQGDRRLEPREVRMLRQWLAAGLPTGTPRDWPEHESLRDTWRIGVADLTLQPRPLVSHQLEHSPILMAELPDEDRFVAAIELHAPTSRFRHALLWLDLPPGTQTLTMPDPASFAGSERTWWQSLRDQLPVKAGSPLRPVQRARAVEARDRRLLGIWSFDQPALVLPAEHAFRFPAGSRLIVELSEPVAEPAITVGLKFHAAMPSNLVLAASLEPRGMVRSGAGERLSAATYRLPVDAELFAIAPQASESCRDLRVTMTLPSGKAESLLWIDRWDPRWTRTFLVPMPIQVPKGSRLEARLLFGDEDQARSSRQAPPVVAVLLAPVHAGEYDELSRSLQRHQIDMVRAPLVAPR